MTYPGIIKIISYKDHFHYTCYIYYVRIFQYHTLHNSGSQKKEVLNFSLRRGGMV